MLEIAQDRIAKLDALVVTAGSHGKRSEGMCINEVYAFLAGEKHTDTPDCVCPSIRAVTMRFNDRCGNGPDADARRKRLLVETYLAVLGTRSTPEVARRRMLMGADWSWRIALPALIRKTSFAAWSDRFEAMPEVVDEASLKFARSVVYEFRQEAWSAHSAAIAKIRAAAAAAAADAAAAAAAAADAAAAVADAVADAAAAAAAAAADAAADAAAADAADAADAAAAKPHYFANLIAAAKKAREDGGDWSARYWAARKVADEHYAQARVSSVYRSLRDEQDAGFIELVNRMAAVQS